MTGKQVHHKPSHKDDKTVRKHEQKRLMQEGLEAIYGNEEVDFSKLEKDQQHVTKLLVRVIVVLGLVAAVAWAGFFVFINYVHPPRNETFALEIVMNEALSSGEQTSVEIIYTNPTTVPIAALAIDINLPSSFIVTSTSKPPTDADQLIWELGELTGLSDDHIVIEGVWLAEVPSQTPIQAYATYRPGNFNSEFEEIAVHYVTTANSLLTMEVSGPEELTPGDAGSYAITLSNTSEQSIENLTTRLTLPNGFYLESSDPALETGAPAAWDIPLLEAGERAVITFNGSFAADVDGFQYFDAVTAIITGDRTLTQTKVQSYTDVLQSAVSITLAANGSTQNVALDQGSMLRVSINLEQTSDDDLEDYSVLLSFEGAESFPVTWSDANLDGGVLTSDGVLWRSDNLGTLESGAQELLNLTFPIKDVSPGDADTFEIIAELSTVSGTVRSSPIAVSINSEADLQTSVRYYNDEGQALGSGPVPPTAGETTSYRVYWTIENDLHALKDIRVSATLPPHVTWLEKTNADLGSISYDSASKTVRWNVSELSTAISHLEAYFTVAITPDAQDVGSFVKLTSGSDLVATDTQTAAQLQRTIDGLTTEAPDDEFASGKGTVIE